MKVQQVPKLSNRAFWSGSPPEEDIRIAHLDDLAAMKLEAINDRRNYRDYVDIAFLSERYTFSDMFKLYKKRTLSSDGTGIIRALSNQNDLVKDQKLHLLKTVTDKQLKDKVDYMLYVYANEQETKHKRRRSIDYGSSPL